MSIFHQTSSIPSRRAFSFVEIIIVVAILGILGAMVIPRFNNQSDLARVNATVKDFRTFETAINVYAMKNNGSMPTSNSELQSEVEEYLPAGSTSAIPPVGGKYGFHSWSDTESAAVAVWGTLYPALRVEIDRKLDDGNLTTGRVRSGPDNGVIFYVFGPIPSTPPS